MECYVHAGTAAIGLCKSCQKGVCRDCVVDTGTGLACSEACATKVRSIDELVDRNVHISQVNRRATWLWPGFYVAMGVLFVGVPYFTGIGKDPFTSLMGGLFIAVGVYLGLLQRASQRRRP